MVEMRWGGVNEWKSLGASWVMRSLRGALRGRDEGSWRWEWQVWRRPVVAGGGGVWNLQSDVTSVLSVCLSRGIDLEYSR